MKPLTRRQMAWRAAQDIVDGAYVNLGIGLPTMVSDFIPADREIVFHSENGILGMGPAPKPGEEDKDLINAGKGLTTIVPGGSFFHHNDAFLMIRGGHLDLALLGAFEVSEAGDLANWTTDDPGFPPGVGGAMDLAVGRNVIGNQRRQADAEVDVGAVLEILGGAPGDLLAGKRGHGRFLRIRRRRSGGRKCLACAPRRDRWRRARPPP